MAIDGIIVLDNTRRPLLQSNFRTAPPAYPLLHVDAYAAAAAAAAPAPPDPVLPVATPAPSACCHVSHGSLTFLCPVRGDDDPLFAFAFLDAVVRILRDYLGELSVSAARDNLHVVYQLLEEMLDDGHPLTTEPNALRDIVLPPSFLNKIASISGLSRVNANPFTSAIPWRKAGLKYNHNEIYFDIVERMDAIVYQNGSVAECRIWGTINSNCRLSGTPDLALSFHNAAALTSPSFHPCVRIPRWVKARTLSFVPPDGRFNLMSYRHQPHTGSNASTPSLPFVLKAAVTRADSSWSLKFSITSRSRDALEQVVLELALGQSVMGVNCINAAGSSWGFDPKTFKLRWDIPALIPSSSHTLRGSFIIPSSASSSPARSLTTSFSIPGRPFSGLKIDQLKLTGELYKPYKGVRANCSGLIEWRL